MSTIKISDLATSDVELTDLIITADAAGVATKNTVQGLSELLTESGGDVFKLNKTIESANDITSIVGDGNFEKTTGDRNFNAIVGTNNVVSFTEPFLNSKDIFKGNQKPATGSALEFYFITNDNATFFDGNSGRYMLARVYTYNSEANKPTTSGRVKFKLTDDSGTQTWSDSANTSNVFITQINENVYEYNFIINPTITGSVTSAQFEIIWEAAQAPSSGSTVLFSGFSLGWADSEFGTNGRLGDDWYIEPDYVTEEELAPVQAEIDANTNFISKAEFPYNNVGYNRSQLSSFLNKYINKKTDINNQLNVILSGDSIIGKMNGSGVTATTGESTGEYPPNMAQELICYKVLETLQYNNSDVQYKNLSNTGFTKSGAWANDLGHIDGIRVYTTSTINDFFEFTITGVSFAKMLFHNQVSSTANFTVLINGVAPSSLGLTGVDSIDTSGTSFKFNNEVWSGLDESTSYTFRFTNNDGGTAYVWGMEFWSNDRINVINTAVGGRKAAQQLSDLNQFSNIKLNQDLIIHELPCINDSNPDAKFKGVKEPNSTGITPSVNEFIYANTTGTYTNYNNLELISGEYAEYDGTNWIKGSSKIDDIFRLFNLNLKYLGLIAETGVPTLLINPHKTTVDSIPDNFYRPYLAEMRNILRTLVNKYGFAYIDLANYYEYNSISSISEIAAFTNDGIHLNDAGINLYKVELDKVLNTSISLAVSNKGYETKTKKGDVKSSDSRTVSFDLAYLSVPEVEIQPYSDGTAPSFMYIDSITESGFVVVGTGAFKWKSFLSEKTIYRERIELVSNGDFENGTTDWSVAGTTTQSVTGGIMQVSHPSSGNWFSDRLTQSGVNFEIGKSYEYSFEARNVSGDVGLRVTQQASVILNATLTGSFQTFTGTYQPLVSSDNIGFFNNGNASVFELDNISVKEIF